VTDIQRDARRDGVLGVLAEALEAKGERRVRTPEGARLYDQPIGSVIRSKPSVSVRATPNVRARAAGNDETEKGPGYVVADIPRGLDGFDLLDAITATLGQNQGSTPETRPDQYETNPRTGNSHLRIGGVQTHVGKDADNRPILYDVTAVPGKEAYDRGSGLRVIAGNRNQAMDKPHVRVEGSDRPLPYVFRVISEEDWQTVLETGVMRSDGRMNLADEGTVTSDDSTGTFYMVRGGNRVVRIRVEPEEDWRVDTDGYVKTHRPIPIDRIDLVTPTLDYDPDGASRGQPNLMLAAERAPVPGLDRLTETQRAGITALRDHPVNRRLGHAFARRGRSLFLVGGSVRDAMAGQPDFADLDYTTDADPEEIKSIVEGMGPIWGIGEAFGTIGVQVDGLKTEITTFRTERYDEESRKPVVEFGDNIADDLRRRDLTMNAMALTMATDGKHRVGELVDPHDGAGDLAKGILRTPDDPAKSMSEDPLRQLRVVRFAARRGATPEPELKAAIVDLADRLGIVAAERKAEELRKIFKSGGAATADAMEMATELTVSKHLFGELDTSPETIAALRRLNNADPTTILGLLAARTTATDPTRAMVAMKLSNDEVRPAVAAARLARQLGANPGASPTDRIDARRIVRDHDPVAIDTALAIDDAIGDQDAMHSPLRREVAAVMESEAGAVRAKLPVDGNDLRQLGLTGPEIGQALGRIMDAFLTDPYLSRAAALAIAREPEVDVAPDPARLPEDPDPEIKAARGVVGRVGEWVERLHPRDRRGRFTRSGASRRATEINAGSPALTVAPKVDDDGNPLTELDRKLRFLDVPIGDAFRKKVDAAKPWGDGPIFDAEGLEQFHKEWRQMDGSPGPQALGREAQLRDLGKVIDAEIAKRLKAAGFTKPLTEAQLDAVRAKRMEVYDRWDEQKWPKIEETARVMFDQEWTLLDPDQLAQVVEKVHADNPDLAAMRAEVEALLTQLVDGSLGTSYQGAYSIAAQSVLSQLRPMGGDVDAQPVIVERMAALVEAETAVESGPNSGVIPYQWRHHGPWDARAPRPVNIDRVAMKDYNRLHPSLQKQVRDAIKELETGGAVVEPKTRALAGTYGVRISKDGRLLVYPHIDGTWHIYAVIPHHDYREAERRMLPADPVDQPAPGARVPGSGRRPPPPPQRSQGVRPRPGQRPAPSQVYRGEAPTPTRTPTPAPTPTPTSTPTRTRPWIPASEIPIIGTIDEDVIARETINAAAGRYPSDWIAASNAAKKFVITQSDDGRGYYRDTRDPNTIDELALGRDLTEHRVAVHELAHRMERIIPAIRAAEWAFLWRRTSKTETDYRAPDTPEAQALEREIDQLRDQRRDLKYTIGSIEDRLSFNLTVQTSIERNQARLAESQAELATINADLKAAEKKLRDVSEKAVYLSQREWPSLLKDLKPDGAYGDNERARPDKFVEPYIGKDYGDTPFSSYEVMSMGMEGLFTGSWSIWKDPEHRNLVLGLLTGA
jgi:tRNA nucleotidyltransferase/poly(A) polymerase